MAKVELYRERQQMGVPVGAGPSLAAPVRMVSGNRTAEKGLWEAASGLVGEVMEVAARESRERADIKVAEAMLEYRRGLAEQGAAYKERHQGQAALDAGKAFSDMADAERERVMETLAAYPGARGRFAHSAAGVALLHTETGIVYGQEQKQLWRKDVLDGALARLDSDIEEHGANSEFIEHQRQLVKSRFAGMFPHDEAEALGARIDERILEKRVAGLLDKGDTEGARALVETLRPKVGDAAEAGGEASAKERSAGTPLAARLEENIRAAEARLATRRTKRIQAALRHDAGKREEHELAAVRSGDFSLLEERLSALEEDIAQGRAQPVTAENAAFRDAAGEGEKEAGRLKERLAGLRDISGFIRRLDEMPIPEMEAAVAELGTNPGSRADALRLETGTRLLGEKRKELQRDPAAAVGGSVFADTPGDTARERLEAQAECGLEPQNRRVLTQAEAGALRDQWRQAAPSARVELLESLAGYEEHAGKAAVESGLGVVGATAVRHLEKGEQGRRQAAALAAAYRVKPDSLPETADAEARTRRAAGQSAMLHVFKACAERLPDNRLVQNSLAELEDCLGNLVRLKGGDVEDAVAALDGEYSALIDGDKAVFYDGAEQTAEALAKALDAASGWAVALDAGRYAAVRDKSGTWVNSPGGDGYMYCVAGGEAERPLLFVSKSAAGTGHDDATAAV